MHRLNNCIIIQSTKCLSRSRSISVSVNKYNLPQFNRIIPITSINNCSSSILTFNSNINYRYYSIKSVMASIDNNASTDIKSNPLVQSTSLFSLPNWSDYSPSVLDIGIRYILTELNNRLDLLELTVNQSDYQPNWNNLLLPITYINDTLSYSYGIISHLQKVNDSTDIRDVVKGLEPLKVEFELRFGQSTALYKALQKLQSSEIYKSFDSVQQRIIELLLIDAKLSGVGLVGESKTRFNVIQQRLTTLGTKFRENVSDSTKAYNLLLTNKSDVIGLPPSALALTAAQARSPAAIEKYQSEYKEIANATSESGPWLITLDLPCWIPFMTYCTNRSLREEVYLAYISRSSSGSVDNSNILTEILDLKKELANLLGYENYAQISLATKLVRSVNQVEEFLESLRQSSYNAGKVELELLKQHAITINPDLTDIKQWDIYFVSENLKQSKYSYDEEELRQYFQYPIVLQGLFDLLKQMYNVSIIENTTGKVQVWNSDVKYYDVYSIDSNNNTKELIAGIFIDPYSRPANKDGGAWMDTVRSRNINESGEIRLPVAHLICNQANPVDGKPSMMSWREVETLFHEMGHVTQHILTRVNHSLVSGISHVEWDAVELPSQLMENFIYNKTILKSITRHIDTNQSVPDSLYHKVLAARTYLAASFMLRQLLFATTDMALHSRLKHPANIAEIRALEVEIESKNAILPPLAENRFLCSFMHIFSGGYSAGYYSYKWAECMSADAYAAFEESGLDENKLTETLNTVGKKYRDTVLSLGGSVPAGEVYRMFRGRDPTPEALLRQSGLLKA